MKEQIGWKGLKNAAMAAVVAVESGTLDQIQEASSHLKMILTRKSGRPLACTKDEFMATNSMTVKEAAAALGITESAVYIRRKRYKNESK